MGGVVAFVGCILGNRGGCVGSGVALCGGLVRGTLGSCTVGGGGVWSVGCFCDCVVASGIEGRSSCGLAVFGRLLANMERSCSSCLRVSFSSGVWSSSLSVERSALVRSFAAATINPSRFATGILKLCGSHFRVSAMLVLLVALVHTLWHR